MVSITYVALKKPQTAEFELTVRNQISQQPLLGVRIELAGRTAVTDSNGHAKLMHLPEGEFVCRILKPGYQTASVQKTVLTARTRTTLRLTLQETVSWVPSFASESVDLQLADLDWSQESLAPQEELKEWTEEARIAASLSKSKATGAKAASRAKAAEKGVLAIAGGIGFAGSADSYSKDESAPAVQRRGTRDVFFEHRDSNPFVDTEDDSVSTFGADVSTASFSKVRSYVKTGGGIPKDAVRVEEMINYFTYGYPAPTDRTFSITTDANPSVITPGTRMLRIGIRAKDIPSENRAPALLTFVVDISGSMNIERRLGLVKKTLALLAKELREGDRIGIVTYGTEAQVVLPPTSGKELIIRRVDSLESYGSTNAEAGLWEGYKLAAENFDPKAINRVILCTDGVANNGETSSEGLLKKIDEYRRMGITLTACGFGMDNYNDVLLENLATQGDGTYCYIDDIREAKKVFVKQLTGTLQVVARDVKIQVAFDPAVVSRYRLVGYEKRDIQDAKFRDDTQDGGEIGAGHQVTALYELKLKDSMAARVGKISLRYKLPDGKTIEEQSAELTLSAPQRPDELRFVQAVALYGDWLRQSYWTRNRNAEDVKNILLSIDTSFYSFEYYSDFAEMVYYSLHSRKVTHLGIMDMDLTGQLDYVLGGLPSITSLTTGSQVASIAGLEIGPDVQYANDVQEVVKLRG